MGPNVLASLGRRENPGSLGFSLSPLHKDVLVAATSSLVCCLHLGNFCLMGMGSVVGTGGAQYFMLPGIQLTSVLCLPVLLCSKKILKLAYV